jgi:predicted dehydrogenase
MNENPTHCKNGEIDVGIVGCGEISDYHIGAWKKAGAKVVAVCDTNTSLAESKAKKWGIPKHYGHISEMLTGERLAATSVLTPAQVRSEVVLPLMEAGINVVIEKPFALSSAEAERMVEAQRKYGVKLTVTHNWLFSYIMRKTLSMIKHGEVGEVLGAAIDVLGNPRSPMTSNPSHWCHSLKGGRFAEMLPHPIYVLQKILGRLETSYVSGSKLGKYDWLRIDELQVLLEDSSARKALIHATLNSNRSEATLRVYGTKAVLITNLYGQTLIKLGALDTNSPSPRQVMVDNLRFLKCILSSNLAVATVFATGRYDRTHEALIKEFVKSLVHDEEPPVTPDEALMVVKTHESLCSEIDSLYFQRTK